MDFQIKSFEEYKEVYSRSVEDPEGFWAEVAGHYSWQQKWDRTLEWNFRDPDVKWYLNGKLKGGLEGEFKELLEKFDASAADWTKAYGDQIAARYDCRSIVTTTQKNEKAHVLV